MSEVIVAKAGGTSNATAEAVEQSLEWAEQSDIFVVSAPGKLEGSDTPKVTDLLLSARDEYEHTGSVLAQTAESITERFADIVNGLGHLSLPAHWVDYIRPRVEESARQSKDAASMLGERLQAEIYQALGYTLLDPGMSHINLGSDPDAWRAWLSGELTKGRRCVLPGNTTRVGGNLVTFDRGGSDISGGLAAFGIRADLNLNLTDGQARSADPKLIKPKMRLRPIGHMLYAEGRELGRNGTGLVHAAAMVPLMIGNIPTEIRSTFDKNQAPTVLDNNFSRARSRAGQVLALSLMRNMNIVQVDEPGMAEAVGRLADFDNHLADRRVPLIDSQGAGVDSQRFFVEARHGDAARAALKKAIRPGGSVLTKERGVDLVTLAGFELERNLVGIIARMARAGILDDKWQQQGHDLSHGNHSIRISVDRQQGDAVLDILHREFIETAAA